MLKMRKINKNEKPQAIVGSKTGSFYEILDPNIGQDPYIGGLTLGIAIWYQHGQHQKEAIAQGIMAYDGSPDTDIPTYLVPLPCGLTKAKQKSIIRQSSALVLKALPKIKAFN